MPASPSTKNYQYGAGACYLKVDDVDLDFRHVGNVPTLTRSLEITTLDHKQSMSGLKSTDFDPVTEVSETLAAVLEEVTPENAELLVMGVAEEDTAGDIVIDSLTRPSIEGDFKYVSDNPHGRQMVLTARVSIKPNGDFNFITDGLTSIPLEMKVLKTAGKFSRWRFIKEEEPTA